MIRLHFCSKHKSKVYYLSNLRCNCNCFQLEISRIFLCWLKQNSAIYCNWRVEFCLALIMANIKEFHSMFRHLSSFQIFCKIICSRVLLSLKVDHFFFFFFHHRPQVIRNLLATLIILIGTSYATANDCPK